MVEDELTHRLDALRNRDLAQGGLAEGQRADRAEIRAVFEVDALQEGAGLEPALSDRLQGRGERQLRDLQTRKAANADILQRRGEGQGLDGLSPHREEGRVLAVGDADGPFPDDKLGQLRVLDGDEPEYTFFEWAEKALDVLFLP